MSAKRGKNSPEEAAVRAIRDISRLQLFFKPARVQQLVTKLKSAAEPLISRSRSEVVTRYGQLMEANKQYVVNEDPSVLLKRSVFTSLSRVPAGIAHMEQEAGVLKQKWAGLKDLPTTEVATYVGFIAELYAWFCIGEIVGRGGSLTGYHV